MALTKRQEAFALAFVELGDATAAFEKAGYTAANRKSQWEQACRLTKHYKVAARIDELRKPAAQKAMITLETHLAELEALREMAKERGQCNAAIAAEIARGKAAGVHIEKTESTVTTRELPASVDEFV